MTGGNWNGLGNVGGLVTSSANILTIGSGANLAAASSLNVIGGQIAAADGTATITGSLNYASPMSSTFAGVIAGPVAALTKTGAATLTLNGSAVSTYNGGTTVNGGTLLLDYSNLAGARIFSAGRALTLGGGTLSIKGNASAPPARPSPAWPSTGPASARFALTANGGQTQYLDDHQLRRHRGNGGMLNFLCPPTPRSPGTRHSPTASSVPGSRSAAARPRNTPPSAAARSRPTTLRHPCSLTMAIPPGPQIAWRRATSA